MDSYMYFVYLTVSDFALFCYICFYSVSIKNILVFMKHTYMDLVLSDSNIKMHIDYNYFIVCCGKYAKNKHNDHPNTCLPELIFAREFMK